MSDEYKGPTWVDDSEDTPLDASRLNPLTRAVESHGTRLGVVEDELSDKADRSAVEALPKTTDLDKKLNATGTKTVSGATTFSDPTTFSGAVAATGNIRFGGRDTTDATVANKDTDPLVTVFNTSAGPRTFQIQNGTQAGVRYIVVKKDDTPNPVIIQPPTSGTLNGSKDPIYINKQWGVVELLSLAGGGRWVTTVRDTDKATTAPTGLVTGTMSRMDEIACYGDSQTAGGQWITRLVESSGTIDAAYNRGGSGHCSGTIAVRQGGATLTLTTGVTITGTTAVPVAFQSDVTPLNQRTPDIVGYLGGVRGTFTVVTPNGADGRPEGTFTATAAPTSPVAVAAGTAFVAEDVADHPEYAELVHIIWLGGNDRAFAGTNALPGSEAAARAMIKRLQDHVDHPRFLVAGPTVYSSEVEGGTMHTRAVQIRDRFAREWPDNAIDIWGHVRDNGLRICGITPTQEDLDAIAAKSMPPSLTEDNIHYTAECREKVVAPYIKRQLALRGWL